MATERKLPIPALIFAALAIAALVACVLWLNRPTPLPASQSGASVEAKAYLPNLELSDVKMQATENFMNQQVVEVQGNIANHGARNLALIEVYCLFFGIDGKEIHRERIPIVRGLAPQDTRSFRLPFDSLPPGWNQALPRLVIAKITFAS